MIKPIGIETGHSAAKIRETTHSNAVGEIGEKAKNTTTLTNI
jgi:hypothetical protein